jgi:hypothetical protein
MSALADDALYQSAFERLFCQIESTLKCPIGSAGKRRFMAEL